jgi:colicin import membrane protein
MPEVVEREEQLLKQEALSVMERARTVKITDQPTYDAATDLLLKEIIPFRRKWADYWKPLTGAAWDAYKKIQAKFKEGDEPAEAAERQVKSEIRRWDDEQIRIEQERQRKAQEAAEKQAEEERLRAAIVAEEAGASETEVSAIVDAPVAVVAEPVAPAYQRTSGISRRENWKAKVTDLHALVKAAAKDKSLLAYLEPNERALNNRAKADRQTLNIPGVVPYDDAVVSARSR